jgi:hypothetical protein
MNKYIGFYNRKQVEVEADTSYQAQQKAVAAFKAPKSKAHQVYVILAAKDDVPVVHTPTM